MLDYVWNSDDAIVELHLHNNFEDSGDDNKTSTLRELITEA